MQTKSFFKRTLFFFRPFWGWLAVVLGMMIVAQGINAAAPLLFGKSVDAVTHANAYLAFLYIGGAFTLSLLQGVLLLWIREYIEISHLDDHIEKAFSVKSLSRMLEFSVGQHINEHSGVKQTVVSKGQNALTFMMFSVLYDILPGTIQIFVTLGVLAFFDWRVALTAGVFVGLYVWLSYNRNIRTLPSIEEVRRKNQSQSKLQSELFRNATLVIAEAQEDQTTVDFRKSGEAVTDFATTTWVNYLKSFYGYKIFILVGQYASLALGVYLILIGKHSVGMFVTLFAWLSAVFSNLTQIMSAQRRMLLALTELRKYYDLLDIVPDIDSNSAGKVIDRLHGEIEFKNVSFAYPYRKSAQEQATDDEDDTKGKELDHAVSGVSFKIPAGAKVGFVGISGSGKSTIVNLMRRFYDPTNGEILIDGVPLKDLNLRWFRSRIGNVEQKIDLFDRSIRENILFGLPSDGKNVADEKLDQVVADASLTDFVGKLKEHGLDTVIGEGGVKVSGGERQRIGIARALIKDPKILIFDEATSALDSINEKLIHDAINRGAKGRTTIIIAHRLSTVMDADIIFVVANGKIVDSGTHEELQKTSSEYQKLIQNQILVG